MELKDILFYTLALVATPWTVKQGYNLVHYSNALREEAPECYQSNPYFLQLFFGTCAILTVVMIPVQAVARSLFYGLLPADKFPVGSKARLVKAEIIAERVFRLLVYCTTSIALFWSLK